MNYAPPNFASLFPEGGINDRFLNENPDIAYQYWLDQQGVDMTSTFGRYAANQYNRLHRQYNADLVNRPVGSNYRFLDYLSGKGLGSLRTEFLNLAPRERGERPNSYMGRVRYIGF